GKVWLEENGAETPVAGLTVSLLLGGEATAVQTVTTAEDGSYRFDGLWPNDYYLQADLPSGMIFVRPNDANYPQGASVVT
ncbi:MAG: SdrD B-like domain-containing protein, partial [Clostridia bacterium]